MGEKIGIMADSHGDAESIDDAIAFLLKSGCRQLVHLGDICDSAHPHTADACVDLIIKNKVIALKGNNDHAVVVNHSNRNDSPISRNTIGFLEALPFVMETEHAVYAHSQPFCRELGLSAMIGAMDDVRTGLFFSRPEKKILFRGHSHEPAIVYESEECLCHERLVPGQSLQLSLPSMVTCGALTRRLCMTYETESRHLACFKIL